MNFLQIAQKIDQAIGSQGNVSSVEASGYQFLLGEYARNAWITIQNLRDDWKFLRTSTDITLTAGKEEYSILDIFSTIDSPVGKWKTDTFLYDYNDLNYIDYEKYIRIKNQTPSKPQFFTVDEASNKLFFNEPDAAYSVKAHYFRKPQVLTTNTDVPLCAPEFHYAIMYQAATDLCAYLGIAELHGINKTKADASLGALLRSANPAKKIRSRGIV